MFQRDVFIQEITNRLEKDKSIFFLSADFGAPALDILREKFPKNFVHCGISEQAMLDIASGLALEGNKVFVYAMSPFLSLRSIEQAKCGAGLMNLPVCVISVGVGLGYADAGPTLPADPPPRHETAISGGLGCGSFGGLLIGQRLHGVSIDQGPGDDGGL